VLYPGTLRRALPVTAVIVALAAVAVLIFGSGGSHTLHVRFADAGQLVKGDLVEIGGRSVGTVSQIGLSDDGQADVTLKLDHDSGPWREGTTARIRAVGLSGVTNRYVQLSPGPSTGSVLPDNSTLDATRTQGIVDLDQVLDSLDARARGQLRSFLIQASRAVDGTAPQLNRAFKDIDPAASRATALLQEIVRDRSGLRTLISSGRGVADILAARSGEVQRIADHLATTLDATAAARGQLAGILQRSPPVLRQATGTLTRLSATLDDVAPVVRGLKPSARPLAEVLRAVGNVPAGGARALRSLEQLLTPLQRGLKRLPGLTKLALPALRQTRSTLVASLPIFAGLRPYAPDIVQGLFNGIGGSAGASYDANGHYARIGVTVGTQIGNGLAASLGIPSTPGLAEYRNDVTDRCPGAAEQPAPDLSNPFVVGGLCSPKDNLP
jgi:phospholipid/cholesterol/gamma-HCH transport system substrate-binding protein